MRALVYNGPRDVQVKDMPDPQIKHRGNVQGRRIVAGTRRGGGRA
jgi:hypothetical protein